MRRVRSFANGKSPAVIMNSTLITVCRNWRSTSPEYATSGGSPVEALLQHNVLRQRRHVLRDVRVRSGSASACRSLPGSHRAPEGGPRPEADVCAIVQTLAASFDAITFTLDCVNFKEQRIDRMNRTKLARRSATTSTTSIGTIAKQHAEASDIRRDL